VARRVVITGAGVLSPLGDSPARVQAALVSGTGAPATLDLPPVPGVACPWGFPVRPFSPAAYLGERNLRPLDRPSCLLTCAAGLALTDSGWTPARVGEEEVGLVVGTVFSGVRTIGEFDRHAQREGPCYASPMDFANTVLNAPAGQAAIWHNLRGVNATVAAGAASGLQALAHAADLIRAGRARAVLAGGVEEISFESFYGLARAGRLAPAAENGPPVPLPFDVRRRGFVLGEGAALLMLEDAEAAAARGATVRAEVKGHASRFDPSRGARQEKATAAIAAAVRLALRDAGMTAAEIDAVSASASGNPDADRHEAAALAAVFEGTRPGPAVTAPKALFGEALGAGGALQALALVEAMRTRTLPGVPRLEQAEELFLRGRISTRAGALEVRHGLVTSVGWDGPCCALVLASGGR
jgi:3-oxoacyl-[acyl-carrier-protein] synthase II